MNTKHTNTIPKCDAFVQNGCFARKLRELRLAVDPPLSQERLAQRLGVRRATLANYESDRVAVPLWFACAAASYFGVEIGELIKSREGNSNECL